MGAHRRPPLALAFVAAYVAVLAVVGWWPRQVDADVGIVHWSPVQTMARLVTVQPAEVLAGVEVAAHAALFVPVGVFIALRWRRASAGTAVVVASALALAIETVQWIAPIDRTASAVDLVADVAGGLLGFVAVRAVTHHPRAGATIVGGLVVIVLGVAAVLIWGMAVSTA
ncbi:hypothetical protein GL325_10900 [Aeromicrobium sp. 636]|uniref:VanZ family protein n=1 Tax=Aeromicrobium senzhongii TaxID=2663859 RepID=A0A8I0K0X1_9ACTN|nr:MULTISPECIES: VanZ family protein [Aeromicrobium]MBC9226836.1 VanZ family protein [Aeromicrobium senzhongii]MCQ3998936.1 hypothetical protein [Aeromicrobium sp. 636]